MRVAIAMYWTAAVVLLTATGCAGACAPGRGQSPLSLRVKEIIRVVDKKDHSQSFDIVYEISAAPGVARLWVNRMVLGESTPYQLRMWDSEGPIYLGTYPDAYERLPDPSEVMVEVGLKPRVVRVEAAPNTSLFGVMAKPNLWRLIEDTTLQYELDDKVLVSDSSDPLDLKEGRWVPVCARGALVYRTLWGDEGESRTPGSDE